MHIAEAAASSGLSIDTIRFYEKSGMLPPLSRDGRGWRSFTPDALDWLLILANLRRTGMPLQDVRRFAQSAHGPGSESRAAQNERLSILQTHAHRLEEKRHDLDACAAYLDRKIAIYSRKEPTQ